jgi:uncharacterized membrane protein
MSSLKLKANSFISINSSFDIKQATYFYLIYNTGLVMLISSPGDGVQDK